MSNPNWSAAKNRAAAQREAHNARHSPARVKRTAPQLQPPKPVIIHDIGGNYPDTTWTRPA